MSGIVTCNDVGKLVEDLQELANESFALYDRLAAVLAHNDLILTKVEKRSLRAVKELVLNCHVRLAHHHEARAKAFKKKEVK